MTDKTQPSAHDVTGDVVLFDGVCHLCNGFVDFVIRRDRHGHTRFASLQSDTGARLLNERSLALDLTESGTIVLVRDGQAYVRSTAALLILASLRFPWRLCAVGLLVPKWLRDRTYGWVARNRYRWFGREDVCRIPTPAERKRFL